MNTPLLKNPPHVLVVDDVSGARRVVVRLLQELGFKEISEAANGQEAWRLLATRKIGLVISDWQMPVMSGLELLEKLRAEKSRASIPFLMATSNGAREEVITAIRAGATDYIVKPFSLDVLAQKLAAVLQLEKG